MNFQKAIDKLLFCENQLSCLWVLWSLMWQTIVYTGEKNILWSIYRGIWHHFCFYQD